MNEREYTFLLGESIYSLIGLLPLPLQGRAAGFLISYSGTDHDIFSRYPSPVKNIIYCIELDLSPHKKDGFSALSSGPVWSLHAELLFWHSLEDHLLDGQIPVSQEILELRSLIKTRLLNRIENHPSQEARHCMLQELDRFYRFHSSPPKEGFASSIRSIRDEAALWLIPPIDLAMEKQLPKRSLRDLLRSYLYFLVAYRLMDDLEDVSADIHTGTRSTIYHALSDQGQARWKTHQSPEQNDLKNAEDSARKRILRYTSFSIYFAYRSGIRSFADEINRWTRRTLHPGVDHPMQL